MRKKKKYFATCRREAQEGQRKIFMCMGMTRTPVYGVVRMCAWMISWCAKRRREWEERISPRRERRGSSRSTRGRRQPGKLQARPRISLFCCFSTRRKEMSEQTRHATPNLLISIHILWLLISSPLHSRTLAHFGSTITHRSYSENLFDISFFIAELLWCVSWVSFAQLILIFKNSGSTGRNFLQCGGIFLGIVE